MCAEDGSEEKITEEGISSSNSLLGSWKREGRERGVDSLTGIVLIKLMPCIFDLCPSYCTPEEHEDQTETLH